ncbi:MAG TPA: hypothetical protein PKE03_09590 [Bacteroidales bacterium]|nr:hypothetical protein [Bacteroidales bacterium]
MVEPQLRPILDTIRNQVIRNGQVNLTFDHLAQSGTVDIPTLIRHVNTPEELVDYLFDYELEKFSNIVADISEELNAIDTMLQVSKRISEKFGDFFPSVSPQLKLLYPQAWQRQFEKRLDFISGSLRRNLNTGIAQGMYRSDLSTELIARLYLARMIDIHNPELFPPESFSFEVLFAQAFESLIRSIATAEGLAYFIERKKHYHI